jgi:hypothetical protein
MACDRYFLSINLAGADQRRFIAAAIDPHDLLVNFVKSDGAIITAIESDSGIGTPPASDAVLPPGPLTIVYRGDDAVSALIGQRLLAVLSSRSVACDLKALNVADYEKAMISRAYCVAVGWVKASVKTDPAERLRLATIWFNDNTDEARRISAFYEKPLFAVQEYILCRNTIAFFGSRLCGISLTKGQ